jgi:hypothetical protein
MRQQGNHQLELDLWRGLPAAALAARRREPQPPEQAPPGSEQHDRAAMALWEDWYDRHN